jgi:hypothetical protein
MPPGSGDFRTQTSIKANTRSAAFGQAITLTATVKNMGGVIGVPNGSVTFLDGPNVLGIVKLHRGKASITIANLPIGQDSIKVVYGGSVFAASTSHVLIESVQAHPTSLRPHRQIKAVVADATGTAGRGWLLRRNATLQSLGSAVKP